MPSKAIKPYLSEVSQFWFRCWRLALSLLLSVIIILPCEGQKLDLAVGHCMRCTPILGFQCYVEPILFCTHGYDNPFGTKVPSLLQKFSSFSDTKFAPASKATYLGSPHSDKIIFYIFIWISVLNPCNCLMMRNLL